MRSFILMSTIILPQLALAVPTASELNDVYCPPNFCTEANAIDPTQHSDKFQFCCSSKSQDNPGVANVSSQSGTGPSLDGQVGDIDSASTIADVQTQQTDGTNTPAYVDAADLKLGNPSDNPTADVNLAIPNPDATSPADDSTSSLSGLESGSGLFLSSPSGSAENSPSSTEPSQNSGTPGASSSDQPQSAGTTSSSNGNGNTDGAASSSQPQNAGTTSSSNAGNGNAGSSSTSPQNSSADTGIAGNSSQNPGDSDSGNPGASSSDQPEGDEAFASNLGSSGTASSDEPQGAGTSAPNNGNSEDASTGQSQGSGTSTSSPQSGTDSSGFLPLLDAVTLVFAGGANPNSIVCKMSS
ncbi:hypothetical protein ONZ45_g11866 [Pleurotus djamor]|nr:hypothetical protein ONZ45_g11866 [Pleurotus djamor]